MRLWHMERRTEERLCEWELELGLVQPEVLSEEHLACAQGHQGDKVPRRHILL
jgi:hypothetical protein